MYVLDTQLRSAGATCMSTCSARRVEIAAVTSMKDMNSPRQAAVSTSAPRGITGFGGVSVAA